MSQLFQRKHYEDGEGATLTVRLDDQATAELTQVEFQDASNEKIDGFSVVFESPPEHAFEQGMYAVNHPEAGEGDVFLVPVRNEDSNARRYELTVVNLKEEQSEG